MPLLVLLVLPPLILPQLKSMSRNTPPTIVALVVFLSIPWSHVGRLNRLRIPSALLPLLISLSVTVDGAITCKYRKYDGLF